MVSQLSLATDKAKVLVGLETGDDAGVYLHDGTALVATADFITPVCDDPRRFGRVAAANSVSDVYAMGGQPLFALNLCCFPKDVPQEALTEILQGGVDVLREADAIFREELESSGWMAKSAQAFAVLLPVQSVGVMGDGRTYADVVALRCVSTDDFMTADWTQLPHELLGRVSNRIINEVAGVNRVVYDVSSKPPATIEWE